MDLWAHCEPEFGQRSVYNLTPSDLTLAEDRDDTLGLHLSVSSQTPCLAVIECVGVPALPRKVNELLLPALCLSLRSLELTPTKLLWLLLVPVAGCRGFLRVLFLSYGA